MHGTPYHDRHLDERVDSVHVNTFYEHINGKGASFTLKSGDQMAFVGGPWNDRISSVRVAPRTQIILYEHLNFTGQISVFTNKGNTYHLWNLTHFGGDNTSAIKTIRLA